MKTSKLLALLLLAMINFNVSAVEFGIFGDFTYSASDKSNENSKFSLGGLDFYATQEFSKKTQGFVELVFENADSGLVTDLERFWVKRSFSDDFNFSVGRFHSPLGRWNRIYHHGSIIQDTVARPFFLDFEDGDAGVLPVHTVGIMFTGDFYRQNDEISYEISIGNGPSLNSSGGFFPITKPEIEINAGSDKNHRKSVTIRVAYTHDSVPLTLGAFVMNNDIAESSATGGLTTQGTSLIKQNIKGLDFLYKYNSLEFLAELYSFSNTNKVGTAGSYNATAWYLQAAYKINDKFKIIARTEALNFDEKNDSYFKILGTKEAKHNLITLRYDMDESNTIKFEINQANMQTSANYMFYTLQWSFLIP